MYNWKFDFQLYYKVYLIYYNLKTLCLLFNHFIKAINLLLISFHLEFKLTV